MAGITHRRQREGWVDDKFFWISAGAWKEIHAGADYNQAAKHLAAAGYLILGDGRHIKRKKKGLPARCYCIKLSILNAEAGVTAAENDRDDAMAGQTFGEELDLGKGAGSLFDVN